MKTKYDKLQNSYKLLPSFDDSPADRIRICVLRFFFEQLDLNEKARNSNNETEAVIGADEAINLFEIIDSVFDVAEGSFSEKYRLATKEKLERELIDLQFVLPVKRKGLILNTKTPVNAIANQYSALAFEVILPKIRDMKYVFDENNSQLPEALAPLYYPERKKEDSVELLNKIFNGIICGEIK